MDNSPVQMKKSKISAVSELNPISFSSKEHPLVWSYSNQLKTTRMAGFKKESVTFQTWKFYIYAALKGRWKIIVNTEMKMQYLPFIFSKTPWGTATPVRQLLLQKLKLNQLNGTRWVLLR